jgi:hypothetical protein
MKIEQSIISASGQQAVKSDNGLKNLAQLVLLFGERELLKNRLHIGLVKQNYPFAQIVGCSTSGEIYNETIFNNEIIVTALFFEKTTIEVAREPIYSMEDSFSVGNRLAERLDKEDLVHVMLFSEGLNINGSELTKGINKRFNDKISVTGGLAGDQDHFLETVTVFNAAGETNQVVAIGFMAGICGSDMVQWAVGIRLGLTVKLPNRRVMFFMNSTVSRLWIYIKGTWDLCG